jgi:hypothetical protein
MRLLSLGGPFVNQLGALPKSIRPLSDDALDDLSRRQNIVDALARLDDAL